MAIVLAENQYGKSRVRLVKVTRLPDRHILKDMTVAIQLQGDFESAHTAGDNRNILPTDTMKNTVYALAKNDPKATGEEQIEEFALRLAENFLDNNAQVSQARVEIEEALWSRINVGSKAHPHAFTRNGNEKRLAVVTATREGTTIEAGIDDLLVLKTTGSGFVGFPHDPFTTLKETGDRILATAVKAAWLYRSADAAFGPCWHGVRQMILETFAEHESRSVQHTLYAMGEAVLKSYDDITEIRFSLPNKHCLLVDLSRFGLENNNEVFQATDEPHGLIEATIKKQ